MKILIGYAIVLASEILMLGTMKYDMRYIMISVLFLIGYALIFYRFDEGDDWSGK